MRAAAALAEIASSLAKPFAIALMAAPPGTDPARALREQMALAELGHCTIGEAAQRASTEGYGCLQVLEGSLGFAFVEHGGVWMERTWGIGQAFPPVAVLAVSSRWPGRLVCARNGSIAVRRDVPAAGVEDAIAEMIAHVPFELPIDAVAREWLTFVVPRRRRPRRDRTAARAFAWADTVFDDESTPTLVWSRMAPSQVLEVLFASRSDLRLSQEPRRFEQMFDLFGEEFDVASRSSLSKAVAC